MVDSEIVAELLLQLLDRLAQVAARILLRHIGPEQRGQRRAQVRPARHAQVEEQRLCFGGKSRIRDAGQPDFGRAEELELKCGGILCLRCPSSKSLDSRLLDENARFAHTLRTHRLLCLGQNVAMLVR